jgi:(5-formylfuran-3-yl)methyl phosphate synthase
MKLLVSVRSAAEVAPALAGGADIIDAKEPSHGSLGPVAPGVLAEIAAIIPGHCWLSAALGDCRTADEARAIISSLALRPRPAPQFLKVGFQGVAEPTQVHGILSSAADTAGRSSAIPAVIAVAYADAARATSIDPWLLVELAGKAGASGILLDTYTKGSGSLLSWFTPGDLMRWVAFAQAAGLLTAVAGSLTSENADAVLAADPDIVGIRGAACEGGRNGHVSEARVTAFRSRLLHSSGILR